MRGMFFLLLGGALGAGLAWLWDDQRGEERRGMMRERFMQATDEWKDKAEMAVKDMEPRVRDFRDRNAFRAQG